MMLLRQSRPQPGGRGSRRAASAEASPAVAFILIRHGKCRAHGLLIRTPGASRGVHASSPPDPVAAASPNGRCIFIRQGERHARGVLPKCLVLLSVMLAPALCGCSGLTAKDRPESSGLVAAPEAAPELTPEEQARQYHAAFTEGLNLIEQGRYGLAIGAFEQAVSIRPQSPEALFNLGACYEAIGDPVSAINIYRQVLALTPNDADCYTNLGTSFIKMYHREKSPVWRKMAREAWRRSLELKPDQPEVQAYLVRAESLD